jgi:hypothetical protein
MIDGLRVEPRPCLAGHRPASMHRFISMQLPRQLPGSASRNHPLHPSRLGSSSVSPVCPYGFPKAFLFMICTIRSPPTIHPTFSAVDTTLRFHNAPLRCCYCPKLLSLSDLLRPKCESVRAGQTPHTKRLMAIVFIVIASATPEETNQPLNMVSPNHPRCLSGHALQACPRKPSFATCQSPPSFLPIAVHPGQASLSQFHPRHSFLSGPAMGYPLISISDVIGSPPTPLIISVILTKPHSSPSRP